MTTAVREYQDIDPLITRIYDSVLHPGGWNDLLEQLARTMNGNAVVLHMLHMHDTSGRCIPYSHMEIDPVWVRRWETDYHKEDYLLCKVQNLPEGCIHTTDDLVRHDNVKRTVFYNDFVLPSNTPFLVGVPFLSRAGIFYGLAVNRPRQAGPFDELDKRLLCRLLPHFQRALHMYRKLSVAQFHERIGFEAMDRLDVGVVLVTPPCRTIFVNKAAARIFRAKDGLDFSNGALIVDNSMAAAKVRRAMLTLPGVNSGIEASEEIFVAIPRPSGVAPYQVLLSTLRGSLEGTLLGETAQCIMIWDPSRTRRIETKQRDITRSCV